MSYQVLARKWRPRTFEELVGQEHVVRALVNGLDSNRLHHAFLFTGTRGVGKTTIARILAKSLNCEQGVSSHPCGKCSACVEVDEGRFVDLIEVDAASRTKVDDTRELLDNVQFAPTRGRYKVYLIDEVHMLSGHSFNALLKTLEEPPPHVKFLLATTDPQRLPVTVLSRCLQFNLKHLSAEQIEAQLQTIVASENLNADPASLTLISRSASGSMRDALSLLDQAIAYSAGKLDENSVREMLGTIDQGTIEAILQALVDKDAAALIGAVTAAADRSMDFAAVLEELLMHLHRVAMVQVDPKLLESFYEDEREQAQRFGDLLSKEDVQLFYQIGIKGRQDINLAPNPRMGLEMVLLRMHTFRLGEGDTAGTLEPQPSPQTAKKPENKTELREDKPQPQVTEAESVYNPSPQTQSTGNLATDDWVNIVAGLKIGGLLQQLADNAVMDAHDDNRIELTLDEKYAQLHNREREAELQAALQDYFNSADLKLVMQVGTPARETPAATRKRISDEKQSAAEKAITSDPNVKALQESFNAEINTGSIRPRS
ncbi:MAG: DNA polymerase III subunit gamma/tau [Acidiferrobacterales bacterium]